MLDEKVLRPACHDPAVKDFKEREQERRFPAARKKVAITSLGQCAPR